jgi:hypothetical protein
MVQNAQSLAVVIGQIVTQQNEEMEGLGAFEE